MIICFDIQYATDYASIAAVSFKNWSDAEPFKTYTKKKKGIEPYEPGKFYLRELPCILDILDDIDLPKTCLIIDGYVFVSDAFDAGLGHYLYKETAEKIPVVGVAKNRFRDITICQEILRGNSKNPLFITSIGIDSKTAANHILNMHGTYRIPTLLKLADTVCREGIKDRSQ